MELSGQGTASTHDQIVMGEIGDHRCASHFFRVGKNGSGANTLLTP